MVCSPDWQRGIGFEAQATCLVQRKVTNGYRTMWAAEDEADIRTVVDAARLIGSSPFGTILKTVGA